jgi:hypothetical protein
MAIGFRPARVIVMKCPPGRDHDVLLPQPSIALQFFGRPIGVVAHFVLR